MLFDILGALLLLAACICALAWVVGQLLGAVRDLQQQVKIMTAAFDALKADVQADKAVVSSVVTLLKGIQEKLANVTSDDDLTALRSDLAATIQPLADAVAANTPAAGPTPQPGA